MRLVPDAAPPGDVSAPQSLLLTPACLLRFAAALAIAGEDEAAAAASASAGVVFASIVNASALAVDAMPADLARLDAINDAVVGSASGVRSSQCSAEMAPLFAARASAAVRRRL